MYYKKRTQPVSPYQLAKIQARKSFSEYIRTRDTNAQGFGYCITCHIQSILLGVPLRKVFRKNADAGHFVSRGRIALFMDEKNVHLQCKDCNNKNEGEKYWYGKALDVKYGHGTADELERRKRDDKDYSFDDWIGLAQYYREKTASLVRYKQKRGKCSSLVIRENTKRE